jgi:F-box and WD-40 domain protein CDC4
LVGHTDTVRSVHILDSSSGISGSKDSTIKVWNLKTGECTATLKHEDQDEIRTIALQEDQHTAFAGTYKGKVVQWNLSTGQYEGVLKAHEGAIYSIVISDDRLFTAGADSTIISWNLKTRYIIALERW